MQSALHSPTSPHVPAADPVIRKATPADIPAILAITHQAFALYAQDIGLPNAVAALQETPAHIQQALTHQHVLVAELDGQVVGSVRYEDLGGGVGYLSRFGVLPEIQQAGVGKALVQAVTQGCGALGLKAIALHTGARVARLVHFYYGAGYFIHSTTTDRGYLRALFIKELAQDGAYNLTGALAK